MADSGAKKGLLEKLREALGQGRSHDQSSVVKKRSPTSPELALYEDRTRFNHGQEPKNGTGTGPVSLDGPKLDLALEKELSPRRLAMITDFMNGDYKIPDMMDPMFMYKVVSDERVYQAHLLSRLKKKRDRLPSEHPERETLDARIDQVQTIVGNLFSVLKHITGKSGMTGGTDFLTE